MAFIKRFAVILTAGLAAGFAVWVIFILARVQLGQNLSDPPPVGILICMVLGVSVANLAYSIWRDK